MGIVIFYYKPILIQSHLTDSTAIILFFSELLYVRIYVLINFVISLAREGGNSKIGNEVGNLLSVK